MNPRIIFICEIENKTEVDLRIKLKNKVRFFGLDLDFYWKKRRRKRGFRIVGEGSEGIDGRKGN